jgi:uncharacterized protein YhdP
MKFWRTNMETETYNQAVAAANADLTAIAEEAAKLPPAMLAAVVTRRPNGTVATITRYGASRTAASRRASVRNWKARY